MTKENSKILPYSVLDLVAVLQGHSHLNAMENSLSLAQHVEKLGFKRFWIAEHHNAGSVVSSATPVLIGYVAQGTKTIRVGSGGVMLPNTSCVDRKSTRLNSSHVRISYAVFCLKKKKNQYRL